MKVEKFKFISNKVNSSNDGRGLHCDINEQDNTLLGYMVTDTNQQTYLKIDTPDLSSIQAYGYDHSTLNQITVS